MIRYTLKCANDHSFESWFRSADAFDALKAAHQLSCPTCGAGGVDKAMMAPRVSTQRATTEAAPAEPENDKAVPTLSGPTSEIEAAIETIRRHVEQNADYVGKDFAAEARKMHDGDTPTRSIYGEARPDEAKALLEDGVQVLPLPFLPKRKAN